MAKFAISGLSGAAEGTTGIGRQPTLRKRRLSPQPRSEPDCRLPATLGIQNGEAAGPHLGA